MDKHAVLEGTATDSKHECTGIRPFYFAYFVTPAGMLPIIQGYRYFGHVENGWLSTGGSADNREIGNLGKLKEAVTLKPGVLVEIPYIEGGDFYPDLAKVGKAEPSPWR